MKDIFKEQLIKRKPNIQTTLSKIAIITGAIALAAAVMLFEVIVVFAPFIWAGIVIAVVIVLKRFSVEFEYALTNHDLDIDIIIAKSRRKKCLSCNVRDFEAFRPVGTTEFEHAFSSAHERKDFSSGAGERHEFLFNKGGKKLRVVFEPNDEILTAMLPFLKRGTYPTGMSARNK